MKKIPTLFERDRNGDKSRVTRYCNTAVADKVKGAVATRKRDGSAMMVRGGKLYERYDCKKGKTPPPDFESCQEPDKETGHQPGWIPFDPEKSQFRYIVKLGIPIPVEDGTYEFCGEKVQGNKEGIAGHTFFRHGTEVLNDMPTDYDGLYAYFKEHKIEGIVWWLNGEPVAKIKRRDFGLEW